MSCMQLTGFQTTSVVPASPASPTLPFILRISAWMKLPGGNSDACVVNGGISCRMALNIVTRGHQRRGACTSAFSL